MIKLVYGYINHEDIAKLYKLLYKIQTKLIKMKHHCKVDLYDDI